MSDAVPPAVLEVASETARVERRRRQAFRAGLFEGWGAITSLYETGSGRPAQFVAGRYVATAKRKAVVVALGRAGDAKSSLLAASVGAAARRFVIVEAGTRAKGFIAGKKGDRAFTLVVAHGRARPFIRDNSVVGPDAGLVSGSAAEPAASGSGQSED